LETRWPCWSQNPPPKKRLAPSLIDAHAQIFSRDPKAQSFFCSFQFQEDWWVPFQEVGERGTKGTLSLSSSVFYMEVFG